MKNTILKMVVLCGMVLQSANGGVNFYNDISVYSEVADRNDTFRMLPNNEGYQINGAGPIYYNEHKTYNIIGNGGVDTIVYDGNQSEYGFYALPNGYGSYYVIKPNNQGVDRISDITYINFKDKQNVTMDEIRSVPYDLKLSNYELEEDAYIGSRILVYDGYDYDKCFWDWQNCTDSYTEELVAGDGSDDNEYFTVRTFSPISHGIDLVKPLDYETKQNLSIRLRSTDRHGLFIEKVFTIAILNIEEVLNYTFELPYDASEEGVRENDSGGLNFSSTNKTLAYMKSDNYSESFKEIKAKVKPYNLAQTSSFDMRLDNKYTLRVFNNSIRLEETNEDNSTTTQYIYDEDNSTTFNDKVLNLNMWLSGGKIYSKVTDELNNQIGRLVENNTTLSNFSSNRYDAKIGNQSSLNVELMDVKLRQEPLLDNVKQFEFLTKPIVANIYNDAVGLSDDNITMYKLSLKEASNKYINKTITQWVKKDSTTYYGFVEVDSKNNVVNDFKSSTNLVERKYIEELSHTTLDTIFRDGGIASEFPVEAKGYRVYEQHSTGATTESILLNKIALESLFVHIKLIGNATKKVTISNLWTYVALPSEINLCIESYKTSLLSLCNQSNSIESVFNSVDTVYKHQGYWSYWDRNNTNYSFDKIGVLNGKDGLLVKSNYATTLNLPFDIVKEIQPNLIDFHQKGWYLTHIPFEMTPSQFGAKVTEQGRILKQILHFNNNAWEIYSPQNDNNFASTITRLKLLKGGDVVWVEVE